MTATSPKDTIVTAATLDRRDRTLHDLRLSLTDHCNLRCRYCLPAEVFGPEFRFTHSERFLDVDQIVQLVTAFASLGVRKLRLTGGEPLLRKDVVGIVRRTATIAGIEDVALTTNGVRLPDLAMPLTEAGLKRINLSCDAIDDAVLTRLAGRKLTFSCIEDAIDAARAAGLVVKLNMVVQRGFNEDQVVPLARYCRDRGLTLRFIEYMDVGTKNRWQRADVVSGREILAMLEAIGNLHPVEPAFRGEVARRYRYVGTDTEVGLINSISQPFCSNCGRARVTATGELLTCLFASKGLDLSPHLQPGSASKALESAIASRWQRRDDRYSELRQQTVPEEKTEMWQVGG
ncbi:MAG: GTP 3',8-cyclase MoaA [Opitutales bacterium]